MEKAIKISQGEVKIRPLLGKDLAQHGIDVFKRDEKVIELCVVEVNGEQKQANLWVVKDWTERDIRKVSRAIMELSELDIDSLAEGEELYEVVEKDLTPGSEYIVVRVGASFYTLRLLKQSEVLALPKARTDYELALRKLAKAIVKIDDAETELTYEELLTWPAGRLLALVGAYGEFFKELDEDF